MFAGNIILPVEAGQTGEAPCTFIPVFRRNQVFADTFPLLARDVKSLVVALEYPKLSIDQYVA